MSFSNEHEYIGSELELFAKAKNWKHYWGSFVRALLRGDVLEVGAGIGETTRNLCDGTQKSWDCLEPDPSLAAQIEAKIREQSLPGCCQVINSTVGALPEIKRYDSIIYIDVLEHIERDLEELTAASRFLKPGGSLIVLSPAHQWLYTPFDRAIGHFRRYTKSTLRRCAPTGLNEVGVRYLDSCGLLASAGNRLLLQSSMPTEKQILFWDRLLVPLSRYVDRIFRYRVGKSVLGIWKSP